MDETRPEVLAALEGVTKRYPGTLALDRVDFDVRPGEIHGLVGENGAGKSTLVKVLAGAIVPDDGYLRWRGQPVRFSSPFEALQCGIGVMHQERNLVPGFSAAENIFLGREQTRYGFVLRHLLRRKALEAARALEFDLDLGVPVAELSASQQQLVEILRLLTLNAQLLVLDEPTASLSASEADRLLRILRQLRARGVGIVYVSHRLDEVLSLCDRVTVLRDGRKVVTELAHRLGRDALIRHMVARDIDQLYPKTPCPIGTEVLRVEGLASRRLRLHSVSLDVRRGEIVGLAGLVGSGRTEFATALFTGERWDGGRVLLEGRPVALRSIDDAVRAGIVLVPEERRVAGLVLDMPVLHNLSLASLRDMSPLGFIRGRREREAGDAIIRRLRIRIHSPQQPARTLSGGNQQKVSLGKWLHREARLFIFDEPTQGIDIQAKTEIYLIMQELARQGAGVLFISSDLYELMGIADRIFVMRHGTVVGEFVRDQFDAEKILSAAVG